MFVIQKLLKNLEYILGRAIMRLPDGVLYALSGGKKTNQAGHQLDARIQMGLLLDRTKPALNTLPPQKARDQFRDLVSISDLPIEPLPRVENFSVPGVARISSRIPMRLYSPNNQALKDLPALIYFHGGGFVIGDLDTYDAMLRYVSKKSGCIVISVDYRLAPDHPYPGPVDDALATYGWLLKNGALFGIDTKKIGVGGDSAGGNLSLNICLQGSSQRLKAPAFQALIYPWVDLSGSQNDDESIREFAQGYALTADLIQYFTRHTYLSTQKLQDPGVSPIFAPAAGFKRIPQTYIQMCGFDPFREQCKRLADRLKIAGVACETKLYPTLIHGATGLAGVVPDARQMLDDYADAVAKMAFDTADANTNRKRAKQTGANIAPGKKAAPTTT